MDLPPEKSRLYSFPASSVAWLTLAAAGHQTAAGTDAAAAAASCFLGAVEKGLPPFRLVEDRPFLRWESCPAVLEGLLLLRTAADLAAAYRGHQIHCLN